MTWMRWWCWSAKVAGLPDGRALLGAMALCEYSWWGWNLDFLRTLPPAEAVRRYRLATG